MNDAINNQFYNEFFENFDKIPFEETLIPLIVKYYPDRNVKLLEIGSGAGALALWLQNSGYNVKCVEPAINAAEKARSKGLNVYTSSFQNYQTDEKFDGILAISSLIHIPRMEMASQAHKLAQLLKDEGILILSLIEGNSEGLEDPTHTGKMRFFSKFTRKEMEELFLPYFNLTESRKILVGKMNQTFILVVLKKSG